MDKLFTAEQKDRVIEIFANRCAETGKMTFSINSEGLGEKIGLSADLTEALLRDFVYKGLIDFTWNTRREWKVTLQIDLFDLKNRGGFVAKEKLAEIEVEKLILEIKALEKTIEPQKYERIMSTIQTLASAIGVFTS